MWISWTNQTLCAGDAMLTTRRNNLSAICQGNSRLVDVALSTLVETHSFLTGLGYPCSIWFHNSRCVNWSFVELTTLKSQRRHRSCNIFQTFLAHTVDTCDPDEECPLGSCVEDAHISCHPHYPNPSSVHLPIFLWQRLAFYRQAFSLPLEKFFDSPSLWK